jgi:hypothetical protein
MDSLLPADASAYLAQYGVCLSAVSLRQYRYRGIGPAFIKVGGRVRYPVAELASYVARVTTAPSRSTKDHRSIAERQAAAGAQTVTA